MVRCSAEFEKATHNDARIIEYKFGKQKEWQNKNDDGKCVTARSSTCHCLIFVELLAKAVRISSGIYEFNLF